MPHRNEYQMLLWLGLVLAIIAVIARGVWLYRASLTWPTADGAITRLGIERKRTGSSAGGHYFCATFTYEFLDPDGRRARHEAADAARLLLLLREVDAGRRQGRFCRATSVIGLLADAP